MLNIPAVAQDVPLPAMPTWTTSEQGIYSSGMIWRDCNNDGVIDVFFSNGNDIVQAANNIYIFGESLAPLSATWYSANLEYSGHCAVGDINDDGFADWVVSNYIGAGFGDPNRSDLYLNQGGLPGRSPVWYTPTEIFSFSCALGDLEGDGDLDIAFATGEGYQNDLESDLIYLNQDGAFVDPPIWMSSASTAALDVTWGDVDNDGDLDLALTYDSWPTSVYYNDGGTLETEPSWTTATADPGNTLIFGDISGDGWLDLIVAYNNQLGGSGRFRVYFNDGAGNLDPNYGWQSSSGGYGSALSLYDYDNDGDDDLAAGRWFSDIWIYENTGTTLTTSPVWSSGLDMVAEELAWVDIDGGGVLDLADTVACDGSRKLFYTRHHPLYAVDSVFTDGIVLDYPDFCYDLVSGWISLGQEPSSELRVYYRYSFHNDLAAANWDTVNMVFENTTPPYVDIAADNTFGPTPLSVQFTDNSAGATGWLWEFGDGAQSTDQNPVHQYTEPGMFDVSLSINTPERDHDRVFEKLVWAYADTLWMSEALVTGGKARVDISARNYLELSELVIPFSWDGAMNLRLDSISVAGLRTEYLDQADIISVVPTWKAATLRLAAGSQPPLAAGDGPVASLFFTDLGSTSYSSPVFFKDYSVYALEATSRPGSYRPETVDGSVYIPCCDGRVGNANNQGGDEPTIGDIVAMIDMLFISFSDLDCLAEADVNQSGGVNPAREDITIGDITILIDYLFVTGPQLGLPDCL